MITKKLYIENINIIKNNNIKYIEDKLKDLSINIKSFINYYMYSLSGIYMIKDNYIYKIIRNDISIEKLILNNKIILIDHSKDIIYKNNYQIPIEHIIYKNIVNYYKLNNKSNIIFVIEKNYIEKTLFLGLNNIIYDYYFLIPSNESINHFIEKEIDTFLSLFTNL